MNPGDIMVQRGKFCFSYNWTHKGIYDAIGTNHGWQNRTKNWTRMYFILNDAQPVEINGKILGNLGADPEHFIST